MIQNVLKLARIKYCEETARSLGHRFDGDAPPTPTPPNSTAEVPFVAKVPTRIISTLPPFNVNTRARIREALFQEDEGAGGNN